MKRESRELAALLGLYALIPVLLLAASALLGKAEMQPYGAAYNAYMVGMEFGVIVLPLLLYRATPWGRGAAQAFWGRKPSSAILLMIPLAVCAYFLVTGVTAAWMALLQMAGLRLPQQAVDAPRSGGELLAALAVVALVPALCEEVFFRGALQPMLSRHMRPWAAIALGGCLFGLIHGQLAALPGHVLLGMGLCLVAWWTRSIWYAAVWHFIQNGMAVLITYLAPRMTELAGSAQGAADTAAQSPALLLVGAVTLIVPFSVATALFLTLVWLTTRDHRQEPLPRAEHRPALAAWTPLAVALGCALYLYVLSGMQMAGGMA